MSATEDKFAFDTAPSHARSATAVRIEPVDNWHTAWPRVLAFVEKYGDAGKLQVDADGWLSARQVLIVAFLGEQIAAHLCFSVAPGRTCIEATLDDHAVAPMFRGRDIEHALHRAAVRRAELLGCEKLRNFSPRSPKPASPDAVKR